MKKRVLFILLAICATIIVGCGGEEKSTVKSTTPKKNPRTESKVTVTPKGDEGMNSTTVESIDTQGISLKDIYAEYGCKAGTCLTTSMINNPTTSEYILSQYNSVTLENDMKPSYILDRTKSIEAGDLVVEFNQNMLTMLKWAKDNNMAVRGHTLIWYSQTPEWIFHEDFDVLKPFADRDTMLARMESFIKQVFEQLEEAGYSDILYAYDVVNEAWMENGSMREENTYWKQTIGEDYLWYAFYFANKYAPEHIDLYYNDYNEQYKTDTLLRFVDTLKDEQGNYLIDGIGLQAHLYTGDNLTSYFKTIDALAATGLKLQITELDVSLGAWQNELPVNEENLKTQGQYYYELISGFMERVQAGTLKSDALTFWGFKDNLSWRSSGNPLLINAKNEAKYSYYGAALIKDKAGF